MTLRTKTVSGHLGSKFIVPVKSPLVVSYLTSSMSNIVSVTVFKILEACEVLKLVSFVQQKHLVHISLVLVYE